MAHMSREANLVGACALALAGRLEADALLERRAGPDGRTRALHLTPAGLRAAAALQAGRFASLEDALGVLDDQERAALAGLAEKLLARITAAGAAPGHTCRLCEPDVCGHPDRCPVTQAAH
jgi:hypothetical protein